ncbi:MAG: DUF1294 domain-containing protein [Clostridiales bacterium]|nr:DUF1294 domain-containing protein [Clostridiales bacterium]
MEFIRENPLAVLLLYLFFINIVGFALMGNDKRRAIRKAYRIPENTLFFVAIIGGSIGTNLGMKVFHHKTLHKKFVIGMPAILLFQVFMGVLMLVQIYVRR